MWIRPFILLSVVLLWLQVVGGSESKDSDSGLKPGILFIF